MTFEVPRCVATRLQLQSIVRHKTRIKIRCTNLTYTCLLVKYLTSEVRFGFDFMGYLVSQNFSVHISNLTDLLVDDGYISAVVSGEYKCWKELKISQRRRTGRYS